MRIVAPVLSSSALVAHPPALRKERATNALLGKCWEPSRFVTRFSALAFLRTSGPGAVLFLEAVNGMKLGQTACPREVRFFIRFITTPAQKRSAHSAGARNSQARPVSVGEMCAVVTAAMY